MNSVLMFQPITDDRNLPREGDLMFRHFDLMPTDPRMLLVEYGQRRGRHLYTKGRNSETNILRRFSHYCSLSGNKTRCVML